MEPTQEELETQFETLSSEERRAMIQIAEMTEGGEPGSEEAIAAALLGMGTWSKAFGWDLDDIESAHEAIEEMLKQGDRAKAKECLQFLAEAHPIDPRAFIELGGMELQDGEPEKAEALFEVAIATHGDDLGARAGRALARLKLGRVDEAMEDTTLALDLDPDGEVPLTGYLATAWVEFNKSAT
jgi:tetratricopeptide (TPR) repeat protein